MSILEKSTVIDLIKTRSASVATIAGTVLKFNNQTAAELHYASHIQILINPKDKQFAIRSCKENAPNAAAFSKPEGKQKYQIISRLPIPLPPAPPLPPYCAVRASGTARTRSITLTKEGEKPVCWVVDRAAIARCMADMIADETLGANESLGITNGRA